MLQLTLIVLIIVAIRALQTQKLRTAVIYLGVFSLSISFAYLLYNAPDVAIAEAVIGSTLATVLYVIALQKYLVFTVYFHVLGEKLDDKQYKDRQKMKIIKKLEVFCAKEELEPQIIFTNETVEDIQKKHNYAIIIESGINNNLTIYSHPENYKQDKLEKYLTDYLHEAHTIDFIYVEEVAE